MDELAIPIASGCAGAEAAGPLWGAYPHEPSDNCREANGRRLNADCSRLSANKL